MKSGYVKYNCMKHCYLKCGVPKYDYPKCADLKNLCLNIVLCFGLLVSSINAKGAIDPDYPITQLDPDTGTRFSIQALQKVSKQKAIEEAIYISSFLNLVVYIIETDHGFSVFSGIFANQLDAPHYQSLLVQSGFRKASIRRVEWRDEQQVASFNHQYQHRYSEHAPQSTSQLRESATKVIGVQPKHRSDMWVSVPNQPRLEQALRKGWSLLSQNNYIDACSAFTELREEKLIRAQATYGLAICYHRSAMPSQSVPLFTELMINEIRVEHILLPLAQDLESLDRHDEAKIYRQRHDEISKDKWLGYQTEESFRLQSKQAIENKDLTTLSNLLNSHQLLLQECMAIDGFYNIANYLKRNKEAATAKRIYLTLLKTCPDKWHLKVGLLYSLSSLSSFNENKLRIQQQQQLKEAPSHYVQRLDTLLFDLKMAEANKHPKDSTDAFNAYMALNAEYPNTPQILSALGWWYYDQGQYAQALDHFQKSHQIQPSKDVEKGIVFSHVQLGNKEKALQQAGKRNLESIKLDLLKEQIGKQEITSPEIPSLAKEIFTLEPNHLPTQKVLAWHYYEVENYPKAKEQFTSLHQAYPEDINLLKGYVYSLLKLGEIDQTETLLSQSELLSGTPDTQDSDMTQVASGIYMNKAVSYYEQEQYQSALTYINKYIELEPSNKDALALRSWIHYHKNERAKAIQDLETVWEHSPTEENAKSLAFLYKGQYEKNPVDAKYKDFLDTLTTSENEKFYNVAAIEYANDQQPIKAAQLTDSQEQSFTNADAIHAHLAFEYRDKSGDKGTSKLQSLSAYLGADLYSEMGKQWRLQLGWEKIDSGSLPPSPFIGRAFLRGDPGQPQQTPHDSDTAKRIWLQHWSETGIIKHASVGTTALSSLIDTQLVFELDGAFATDLMNKRKTAYWNIHQRLVDESLLSYIGQYDPYSQDEWGRVLKSGATLGNQWALSKPYWVNGSLTGDYYWGHNIWKNWSVSGNAAIGRTDTFEDYQRSLGIYGNLAHFDKDTNYFTFGHGGYYSPQALIGAGPFASWEAHKKDTTFWWKAETSIGVFWESTDGAPLYPLDQSAPRATGNYQGDSGFGVGAQLRLQYRKLWNRYFETSGLIDWRQSPDYNETRIQATFRIYFEPRNALTTFDVYDRVTLP